MPRMSPGTRKHLPGQDFAGPHRTFPINNRAHAEAAIMDAPAAVKAGHLTSAEAREVVATAKRRLRKS